MSMGERATRPYMIRNPLRPGRTDPMSDKELEEVVPSDHERRLSRKLDVPEDDAAVQTTDLSDLAGAGHLQSRDDGGGYTPPAAK